MVRKFLIFIPSRPPLVPPFIILAHIFNLFSYMFKLWCKPKTKSKQAAELHNAMMTSMHAASRPVSPTHDIRGISVEIEQIKERRRSGKRPFRTYHKSARSFNFPGWGLSLDRAGIAQSRRVKFGKKTPDDDP